MIKLADVAREANVSEATVSLVINNKKGVSDKTRERVLKIIDELGYTPNNIARGLATNETKTIGVIVTNIDNPFFGEVTHYIDKYVRKEGYNLILSVSNDEVVLENQIIKEFISKRVDGVIVIPSTQSRNDFTPYKNLNSHNIPYVFSTSYYPTFECDCIMANLKEGSYKLTKYLLNLGHRKINFLVSSNREDLVSKMRINGYKDAFKEKQIKYNEDWIIECKRSDFLHGYNKTITLLKQDNKPDVIISINDFMALGVMKAIKEFDYQIPEDISVAGYDDLVFSSLMDTPLTTVRQDIPRICLQTVDILMNKINGGNENKNIHKISTELIIRDSTCENISH